MPRKRKLGGIVVIGDCCDEETYYGRVDEFPTSEQFMKAAREEADYLGRQDCTLDEPMEVLLRAQPFGGEFDILLVEVEQPGRGVWKSWKTEVV